LDHIMSQLKERLKKHEGFNNKPAQNISGKLIIGYGWDLSSVPISKEAAEFILNEQIKYIEKQLIQYEWYKLLPPGVQDALVCMAFNMGVTVLMCFKEMILALINKDYTTAAKEVLSSSWGKKEIQRAKDVALTIREGK